MKTLRKRASTLLACSSVLAVLVATPVQAQTSEELRSEVAQLRARIDRLEAALAAQETHPQTSASFAAPADPAQPVTAATPALAAAPPSATKRLNVNGDVRVRYESNFGRDAVRNRDRGVVRGRLRASYAVNSWLTAGGELSTGDLNDPNSTDVTLTRFADDLSVGLSQAYLRAQFGNLTLTGGKMPQPFVRTELTWDGDVNPQGLSASYKVALPAGASVRANALYFLVDEASNAKDSRMIGGQLQFETAASNAIKLELAAGYYDYDLGTVAGADIGDFRTNRFAGNQYLSDFNLLDVVGAVQFNGLGERWPVRVVGNYVHNYGATTDQDTGYGVDLYLGRGSKLGDWRFGYGYAQTGVDAVLAAFSHDNTDLATNYIQHTLLVDYVVSPGVTLNATWYRYKQKSLLFTPGFADWANRVRLNMLATF
ncbi:MAG: putative porin [Proteobacteria bacterium]|nr:putative porin [Pseudomonadota bacterium]